MSVFLPRTPDEIAASWPAELDHFSASGSKMAVRCPEQWRQHYVLGLTEPPDSARLWGRADHHAIERNYLHKLDTYEDLPVGDVAELFAVNFDEEVSEAGGPREIKWKHVPVSDDRKAAAWTKDQGVKLVTMYREEVTPYFQPTQVEQEFSFDLPFLPVPVVGRIDLIVTDTSAFGPTPVKPGEQPARRIQDRKTSGSPPRKINPDWAWQAAVYQLVEELPFEWHFSVKPKEGKRKQIPKIVWGSNDFVQLPPTRAKTIRALEMVVASIGHYMTVYGPDQPWPPHGKYNPIWNGSACDYCGFRPTCFWWEP